MTRMIDVSEKDVTVRTARATGKVLTSVDVVAALRGPGLPKGDVAATARLAGIMGAKRTPDLVPLCHPIGLAGVEVRVDVVEDGLALEVEVRNADRTGVEMEALTAVTAAALTVVDMVKGTDPAAEITAVRVEEKTGGKTGDWTRP